MNVQKIYELVGQIAPFSQCNPWDNSGLLAGDPEMEVTSALCCLDIVPETLAEASRRGANLLISHHPVIFDPLKSVTAGNMAYEVIRAGMAAICAHTCLDRAEGGVNDCLAETLDLRDVRPFAEPGDDLPAIARIGTLSDIISGAEFAWFVKNKLRPAGGLRYADSGRTIQKVAVCGGAGGSLLHAAKAAGADALVTADLKHNVLIECLQIGLTAVDAGHFDTEKVVLEPFARRLSKLAPKTPFFVSEWTGPVRTI